jgi:tRNA A-37 threonylcarbamoyl transferase component Bud32
VSVSDDAAALDGRYTLDEVVGRGGMADVYRATDRVLDRVVAVKLLRDVPDDENARSRFHAEARTLAGLSHPGLVTVLDAGIDVDPPYLVLEYVDGQSLAEALDRLSGMPPAQVADIGAQVADALHYAHAAGIVHRDVKPGNILLGPNGRVWLTDFGIARLLGDVARHTKTGLTIGTAAYLAPEQVRGEAVTPAADVYSLGLVLLEALTGQRVYQGSPTEAALARLHGSPAMPPTVTEEWQSMLGALLTLDPADRPTAGQVAALLHGWVDADAAHTAPMATGADTDPEGAGDGDATAVMDPATAAVPAASDEEVDGHSTMLLRPEPIQGRAAAAAQDAVHAGLAAVARAARAAGEKAGPASRAAAESAHAATGHARGALVRSVTRGNGLVLFWCLVAAVIVTVWMLAITTGQDSDGKGDSGSADGGSSQTTPKQVPERFREPLQNLDDAIHGEQP